MCGIAGCYQQSDGRKLTDVMTDRIAHRGPDAEGVWSHEDERVSMHLGHRRLSIIDLSAAADQPLRKGSLVLSYNGELYNFKELRAELQAAGATFATSSDTEVVLEGWRHWGPAALDRFRGIFAFALADTATGELVLARDPLGIKPLFYTERGDGIVFASELKAIVAALGSELRIEPGALVASMLEESVRAHLVADVPVSSFLSGGLDSSIITVLAHQDSSAVDAYTITFRPEDQKLEAMPDDAVYARKVAARFGIDLHEIEISPDIAEMLPRMVDILEEARFRRSYTLYDPDGLTALVGPELGGQVTDVIDEHAAIYNDNALDDEVNRMCLADARLFMAGLNLTYTDRASMAASVEVRVPFVDKVVAQAAFTIPGHDKIRGKVQKAALKDAAENWLPREIVHRPKASFGAPLRAWVRNDLGELINDVLVGGELVQLGLLRRGPLLRPIADERASRGDYAKQIWQLLSTELWYRQVRAAGVAG